MSAKDNILSRLRKGKMPFVDVEAVTERTVMVPMDGANLLETFVTRAEGLSAKVHQLDNDEAAIDTILGIIGDDKSVLAWDFEHIPLKNLEAALQSKDIARADARDGSVRVGITGVEVALAATGSIIISAREGRFRSVSLLPYVHIAVLREEQILPHFDSWLEQQSQDNAAFRQVGNHVVITGASRTADIGMELVLGAHGPAELHLIILPE